RELLERSCGFGRGCPGEHFPVSGECEAPGNGWDHSGIIGSIPLAGVLDLDGIETGGSLLPNHVLALDKRQESQGTTENSTAGSQPETRKETCPNRHSASGRGNVALLR